MTVGPDLGKPGDDARPVPEPPEPPAYPEPDDGAEPVPEHLAGTEPVAGAGDGDTHDDGDDDAHDDDDGDDDDDDGDDDDDDDGDDDDDAGQRPPAARRPRYRAGEVLTAGLVLLPSLVVFAAFFFYPLYRLVHLSVHRPDNFGRREIYVGPSLLVDNLTGPAFTDGLRVTLLFVVFTVPAGIVLGTLLAVAAHRRLRGIRIFQTIFSSTVASSAAVASVVFLVLVNPEAGYFRDVGFISLADPDTALRGVALAAIWNNLGLTFVIVLAGLQAVPDEIMEAAALDGFGPLRRFFRVTVPLLSPTLLFLVVVLVIFAFQAYAQMDILTQGGPVDATQSLLFRIVENRSGPAASRGAALSLGLFGVTLLVTLGQFLLLERRVHYGR